MISNAKCLELVRNNSRNLLQSNRKFVSAIREKLSSAEKGEIYLLIYEYISFLVAYSKLQVGKM